jgi:CHAT domain-containing protein
MRLAKSYLCFLVGMFLFNNTYAVINQVPYYKQLFSYAEKLSNSKHASSAKDQKALKAYLKVVDILTKSNTDNSFLFRAFVSTGTFLQVLNRQRESSGYFKRAILLKKALPELPDSILFKPLVYCGNAYYQLYQPDSAAIFYHQAENIADKYPRISELERLYNTLGIVAYSGGNYIKSITFYQKAISVLMSHRQFDNVLLLTYKNNLASALRKLKRYDEALTIFKGLLNYHAETDKILHNIGTVYLAMGESKRAITYLKAVKQDDQKKLNDLGRAYFLEENDTNAIKYFQKAEDLNTRENRGFKNSDHSITLKYWGDFWLKKQSPVKALPYYQQAINNLLVDFNSTNIYVNPVNFTSVFNTIELLETLKAKARAFQMLYAESGILRDLESSLQTYFSFYALANYVERIYDNDESRFLISDRKYASREEPFNICLQLFKLTGNKKYIAKAFSLDEENKANTLALYLEESKIKSYSGIPTSFLKQEAELKKNITRIALQAADEIDSVKLIKLKKRINDFSIDLLKIQRKISQGTNFGRLKFRNKIISIDLLQKIIPDESAILSYHTSDNSMVCFIITNSSFNFFITSTSPKFSPALEELYMQTQNKEGSNGRVTKRLGNSFYNLLIKPAEKYLAGKKDLMIIPDNELNYLPFEILADNNGKMLLNQFSITYNYSCTILQNENRNAAINSKELGMAPFADNLGKNTAGLDQLPSSRKEIEGSHGMILYDKAATKQRFLKNAGNFNVIHLATHAYANDKDPSKSYIAFFPSMPDSAIDYKLYLPEIYNLKLDKTRLVILSACESGTGQFVGGEGLMSLSRAFSYAGCYNIITSMWKADDASTAYISERVHLYLERGYELTKALQRAKLDYLSDHRIASAQKLPGYWAHLRLTGGFQSHSTNAYWVIYISIILLLGVVAYIYKSRIRKLIRLL